MTPHNDNEDSGKLKNLKEQLEILKEKDRAEQSRQNASGVGNSNLSIAMRACTELIASIGVCGAIGYGADGYFETRPFLMILGLLTGMGVGFAGVYRITNNMGMSVGYMQQHLEQAKKEDEALEEKLENKKDEQSENNTKQANSVSTRDESDDKK